MANHTLDKTIAIIQQLGFSANEARAYVALLACQPASAYEVAKKAGVPTSKIYAIVDKLVAKSVIQPTIAHQDALSSGKRQHYIALKPSDFLKQIKETTISHTNELYPLLEHVSDASDGDFIWSLINQTQIVAKAHEIISQAREYVLLSCWAEELDWLADDLRAAESRSVNIALVHFGLPTQTIGATYHHPVEKTLYQEKGGRGLTLVADETVLIANYKRTGTLDAAWSRNQAFVTVAEDYIKHDVYITKVTRFLNAEMLTRFGSEYEKLRDVFNADA